MGGSMCKRFNQTVILFLVFFIWQSILGNTNNPILRISGNKIDDNNIEAQIQFVRDIICPRQQELRHFSQATFADWVTSQDLSQPFSAKPVLINNSIRDGSKLCVVVNSVLYPFIEGSIIQYVADLTIEGYIVEVHTAMGGTPLDFRTYLQGLYADGMNGCLLIGDLPVAWYKEAVPI
jgi:hypothetical protein